MIFIRLSIFLAFGLVVGCATNGRPGHAQPPIVGTWVLNAARTSPAAATNPALASTVTATMTFSPDGKYLSSATFNGHTNDSDGTWRMIGSDIYIDYGEGEHKSNFEIRGDELMVKALHEPGVLVFQRQR